MPQPSSSAGGHSQRGAAAAAAAAASALGRGGSSQTGTQARNLRTPDVEMIKDIAENAHISSVGYILWPQCPQPHLGRVP